MPKTMSVTMLVDLRYEAINANHRGRWSRIARTRILRDKSAVMHRLAVWATHWIEPHAHLTITVSWPNHHRRDVANLMPTFKALIDGAIDAHVLPDDDDTHLVGPDLRVTPELSGVNYAARVVMQWSAE